ncbi:MAG: PHB depolymerase family esterase [Myxococcota bacterium]
MRVLLPLLLVGCFQPHVPDERPSNACDADAFPRAEMVINVKVGGKTRRALVWMPNSPGPHPVVVNMHEFRANPRTQARYSGWADFVTESGAIVVSPDGKYATWNAGECCGRAVTKHVNDVAYLDAVIDALDRVTCTDGQVLATGIGNGGMMAEMWACESDKPDAVVSVGGSLQWRECRTKRPIPYLHYHGAKDTFIPMDASATGLAKQEGIQRTLDHAHEIWAARNGATEAEPVVDGDLTCRQWSGNAPMQSCIVADGIDTWPGAGDAPVKSNSPLASATRGAWGWVQQQWKRQP